MVSIRMSGSVCQDRLSIHVPCLLPNHLLQRESLKVYVFVDRSEDQQQRGVQPYTTMGFQ